MSGPDLSDYNEVPERLAKFFDKYPDGSIQGDWSIQAMGENLFVVYVAQAYRTPDDPKPGMGTAWEPFPGKTNFTRDSELMNAETSAWGRALVALGFVAKKIASQEEVQARQGLVAVKDTSPSSAALVYLCDDSPAVAEGIWGAIKQANGGVMPEVVANALVEAEKGRRAADSQEPEVQAA